MDAACPEEQLSTTASIVLSLWFTLSGLAAVAGNALVLFLFLFQPLLSLAVGSRSFRWACHGLNLDSQRLSHSATGL